MPPSDRRSLFNESERRRPQLQRDVRRLYAFVSDLVHERGLVRSCENHAPTPTHVILELRQMGPQHFAHVTESDLIDSLDRIAEAADLVLGLAYRASLLLRTADHAATFCSATMAIDFALAALNVHCATRNHSPTLDDWNSVVPHIDHLVDAVLKRRGRERSA